NDRAIDLGGARINRMMVLKRNSLGSQSKQRWAVLFGQEVRTHTVPDDEQHTGGGVLSEGRRFRSADVSSASRTRPLWNRRTRRPRPDGFDGIGPLSVLRLG